MTDMIELLTMLAVPAAFCAACRYLNVRSDRATSARNRDIDAVPSLPRS